jgi:6-phosphogluconolactonase
MRIVHLLPLLRDHGTRLARLTALLPLSVLLAACGGGGGGGGPPVSSKFLYAAAYSVSASGTVSGAIYAFSVDPATGAISPLAGSPFAPTSGTAQNAIAITRDSKFLYAGAAAGADSLTGILSAFLIHADGSLTAVSGAPFSTPDDPEVLVAHPTADFLYVAGASGKVTVFAIDTATGALILRSSIDTNGAFPNGTGFTADGRYYYQSSYLNSQIAGFAVDAANGALSPVPGSPYLLTPSASSNPGDIAIDPAGKFVYILNSFVDLNFGEPLWAYSINAASGALAAVPGSPFSTGEGVEGSATIDSTGKFLIVAIGPTVSRTNCLSVSSIDPNTGALTLVPGSPFGQLCGVVIADPSGPYVYTAAGLGGSTSVFAYSIDQSTGALSPIGGVNLPDRTVPSIALTH